MQTLTRNEIQWIAGELSREADRLTNVGELTAATQIERGLCQLKAEQYRAIAGKLKAALEHNDRRIAIR